MLKWMQKKHAEVIDPFRINKNQVKMIFVDETLIQIDGKDYWLWFIPVLSWSFIS